MALDVATYNAALQDSKKYTDQRINEVIQEYLSKHIAEISTPVVEKTDTK